METETTTNAVPTPNPEPTPHQDVLFSGLVDAPTNVQVERASTFLTLYAEACVHSRAPAPQTMQEVMSGKMIDVVWRTITNGGCGAGIPSTLSNSVTDNVHAIWGYISALTPNYNLDSTKKVAKDIVCLSGLMATEIHLAIPPREVTQELVDQQVAAFYGAPTLDNSDEEDGGGDDHDDGGER